MLGVSDFIHIPYTSDLTQAGIAYACRWLTHPIDYKLNRDFASLRQMVARIAVELALMRYLREQNIPFTLQETNPFSDPSRVGIGLGGHWCILNNSLITHKSQVGRIRDDPSYLLTSSVLISPNQYPAELYSQHDLYIISFTSALPFNTNSVRFHYFIHPLPRIWSNPASFPSPGRLALRSNLNEVITILLGGLGEDREFLTESIDLLPGSRVESRHSFISASYLHAPCIPNGQIGIYSSRQDRSYLAKSSGWGNIWVDGMEIILAGYLEFGKLQTDLMGTSSVWYSNPEIDAGVHRKALQVSSLRPLNNLFNSVRVWSHKNRNRI